MVGVATTMNTQPRNKGRDPRMPVVFAGHGSPMNAIEENRWSRGFVQLAELVPRPRAIVMISAHWFVDGTYLTGAVQPRTIHDFSGFPQSLYEIGYSARGNVDLAKRVQALLPAPDAALSLDWGLDHGAWSVLRWMFPKADVPVIQLSIDRGLDVARHYDLGQSLAPLREEGVLIVGSGNVVHNLRDAFGRMRSGSKETPHWARAFDDEVKNRLGDRDTAGLLSTWKDTELGRKAHPTPDHWLPLIYAYAASNERDAVCFPTEGFDAGSLSMRNAVFA